MTLYDGALVEDQLHDTTPKFFSRNVHTRSKFDCWA